MATSKKTKNEKWEGTENYVNCKKSLWKKFQEINMSMFGQINISLVHANFNKVDIDLGVWHGIIYSWLHPLKR